MSFLDKNGLQVLTTKLVQGDAIKVASHRGHTVKNVIDNITRECENISTPNTMNLENRINEFKVGKGRDVDVSGDVEEGKINVELQGKTWQNVVHGKKSIQSNIFTIEDGKYVFNNNATRSGGIVFSLICKPNTTYTLIINFLECALGDNTIYIDGHSVYLSTINKNLPKTKGTHAISFVTKDDVTDKKMKLAILNSSTSKLVIDENIIVLEGDHTQTPTEELPKYFEGIKSSFEEGIVDVEVTGKNLFDKKTITVDKSLNNSGGSYENVGCNISDFIEVESNSSYVKSDSALYCEYDKDKNFIARYGNTTIVTSANCKYIRLNIISSKLENYQLEKGKIATPYEPYYKKKISFNIGEPLRSLPNGVCDEITDDGRLIRRVGKVVLNGSEKWVTSGYTNQDNTMAFALIFTKKRFGKFGEIGVMCPDFKSLPLTIDDLLTDTEVFMEESTSNNKVLMRVNRGRLATQDLNGFKQWLSKNPTTVYYELETPIITPIEPMEFDVKPLATMTINSDIAPVSNHKVVLNRAGQIEQGIVQIAELKKRVDSLETAYDSYLLETQHKLSILGFEYELESEEV